MVTKRNVLLISLVGTLLILALFVLTVTDFCYNSVSCSNFFIVWHPWNIAEYFFFTPPILLFSLITYWMKDEVFRVWWNFARWMVPIIILATVAIQFVPRNGGFFNMDSLIYLMVLAPLYTLLILVSLWKIFRKYRELKHAK